jgi:hypothetical protein
MHCSRLVGGLAALAALLILLAAPAAGAASLTPAWSDSYATGAGDSFNAIATGPGGLVYAAGFTGATAGGTGGLLLLVKYVDTGATMTREWSRTFNRSGYTTASASKVAVDAAGNIFVAGTLGVPSLTGKGSDIVVLKYTPAGVRIGVTVYDGPAHLLEYVNGLALDAAGNAFVTGASGGRGTGRDYVTIKVHANGHRAWVRRYAGPDTFDEARGLAVSPTGTVYVTGWSNDKDGTRRARTICYSAAGVQRWMASDTTRKSWSGAAAVMLSRVPGARGVIVSGYQGTHAGHEAYMFTKYRASDGNVIWKRILPNGAQASEPHAAAIDGTGAPIAAGMTNLTQGGGYLAGFSASGGDAWGSVLSSEFTNPGEAEFDALAVSAGGAVLAGGWTQAAEPAKELWDFIPTAFAVRYSPGWPITAPLDYIGPGSATTQSRCNAVAIGTAGMYAVGEETGIADGLDAVLVKF